MANFTVRLSGKVSGFFIAAPGTTIDSASTLNGWADTLFTFEASNINPSLVNYTSAYYDMFSEYGQNSFQAATMGNFFGVNASNDGVIRTAADLKGQGLLNGNLPASVYSLYGNHGTMYNTYAKQENTQTSFKASGSADIKSHEFSFGFEFEQRKDYYWGISPMGLWGLMRQQANKHILERDLTSLRRAAISVRTDSIDILYMNLNQYL